MDPLLSERYQHAWIRVAERLDSIQDLLSLSCTCRSLHNWINTSSEVWQTLVMDSFVTPWLVTLPFRQRATHPILLDPTVFPAASTVDWRSYFIKLYQKKYQLLSLDQSMQELTLARDVQNEKDISVWEKSTQQIQVVRQQLERLAKDKRDTDQVVRSCLQIVWAILEDSPAFLPAYYYFGVICWMLGDATAALHCLQVLHHVSQSIQDHQLGDGMDDEDEAFFECVQELEQEILNHQHSLKSECEPLPLLEQPIDLNAPVNLSKEVIQALRQVFSELDRDQDGQWSFAELAMYLEVTHGHLSLAEALKKPMLTQSRYLSREMFKSVLERYEGGRKRVKGLSVDGLLGFYLDQTMQEPEETRRDLVACGFPAFQLCQDAEMEDGQAR